MRRNLGNSRLPHRRRRGDPMAEYDRLPPELRRWLAAARLPWSPRSALRIWRRALARHGGDPDRARGALTGLEAALLRKDCARVWGPLHPELNARAVLTTPATSDVAPGGSAAL